MPVTGTRIFSPRIYGNTLPSFRPRVFLLISISALLSLPLLVIIGSFFVPASDTWQHLSDTVLSQYIVNSLILMLGVGILTIVLGVIPAWFVTMYRFPGSRMLEWALLLPLAMPAYIIAYTYTGVLDASGPLQSWLRDITGWGFRDYWFPEIRSLGGAIAMLSFVLYPYIYLITRAAFIEQSICALETARTLGCGPCRTFFRVALPLARPSIIVGLSLVLMETLADYGTVQYFGISAFTTGIFRTWFGLGDSAAAAQLSALLMLFVMVLIFIEYWSRKQQRYHHTSSRYGSLTQNRLNGMPAALATFGCSLPVVLGFLVPVAFLIHWAFLTYADIVDAEFLTYMQNSILLAGCAALVATTLAMFMAYGKRRDPGPLTRLAVNLSGMGYAIPGTVIAVGVMLPLAWLDKSIDSFFRAEFDISTGLLLSGTLVAVMFAYMVRFLAVALKTVDAGLTRIKPSMEEAGRSIGVSGFKLIRKIHIPIMRGSLLTALLLVFVDVLKELPATLILRPFNFNTLAIRAYELANEERLADASCSSLAIVLVGIIPVIYLSRTISKSRPGHDTGT
ncbi:MAG TPA: iron ABC transporter permease [Gammaproteobacteria bacterium]|nr:iron ABC transporter permease [Gammaproteobacteria bacterium]